jgi:hypothetical protein
MKQKKRQINYVWRRLKIIPIQWRDFRQFGLKKETAMRHLFILSHNGFLKFPFGLKMKNQHDWFFILFLPKFIIFLKRGEAFEMKKYPSMKKTWMALTEAFRRNKKHQRLAYPLAKKLLKQKLKEKQRALKNDELIYFPSSKFKKKENKFLPYKEVRRVRRHLSALRAKFRKVKSYYKRNPERRRLSLRLAEAKISLKGTREMEELYKTRFKDDFWAWLEWYYPNKKGAFAYLIKHATGYEERWWTEEELRDKRKALSEDKELYEECYKRWRMEVEGWIGATEWAEEELLGIKEEIERRFGKVIRRFYEIKEFILKVANFCKVLRERRFHKYGRCYVRGKVRCGRNTLPANRTTISELVFNSERLAKALEEIKRYLSYA